MSMPPGNMLGKTKVVEGIYSMEGDFCRLRLHLNHRHCQGDGRHHVSMGNSVQFFQNQGEIVTLKNKYGAYLYLDEAPMLCMPTIVVKLLSISL